MWKQYLNHYDVKIISDEDTLLLSKNSLIIFNVESTTSSTIWIKNLLAQNNKILLLQGIPDFIQGKRYLELGIQGYGNTMMSEPFLNSAVMSIIEGFIWIHPQFTQKLISKISSKDENSYYLEKLSPKEQKVALLVCEGLNNIEISNSLNISVNTVKTHLKKIYEKLNVKDRLALVILLK
jgi:DNA-binding NarL/FixJ family response regulator